MYIYIYICIFIFAAENNCNSEYLDANNAIVFDASFAWGQCGLCPPIHVTIHLLPHQKLNMEPSHKML